MLLDIPFHMSPNFYGPIAHVLWPGGSIFIPPCIFSGMQTYICMHILVYTPITMKGDPFSNKIIKNLAWRKILYEFQTFQASYRQFSLTRRSGKYTFFLFISLTQAFAQVWILTCHSL